MKTKDRTVHSLGVAMRYIWILSISIFLVVFQERVASGQQVIVGYLGGKRTAHGRGMGYLERGEYREAIAVFESALRTDPTNPDLHQLLGIVWARLGDLDSAIGEYTKAIRHGSRLPSIFDDRGGLYAVKKDWVHAIADFNEAIRIDPDTPEYYYNRAYAYLGQCQYLKARQDLERACVKYREAGAGFLQENENLARYAIAKLLATCPDATVRDGAKAIEYARMACEKSDFKNPIFLDVLAASHAEAGQWVEAARRAEQALELADSEYREEIRMRLELYRLHEPYRQFPPERSTGGSPTTAAQALLYGIAKISAGDRAGAIADMRKAVELNPLLVSAQFRLGLLTLAEDATTAISYYNRCLDLDPKHSGALARRAEANVWLDKPRVAISDAKAALALDPGNLRARSAYVWALGSLGEIGQAFRELDKMKKDNSANASLNSIQGHCYFVQGRLGEAVRELTEAIRRNPSCALAYAERAVVLSAMGKKDDARRDVEACDRLAPSLRGPTEARINALKARSPR